MYGTATVESPAQHMRALEEANRVRLARSDLKRRIGRGDVTVDRVIEECPWEARTMAIAELLRSQHRWGGARCRRFLNTAQIPERKQVGALTARQRDILIRSLSGPDGDAGAAMAQPLWPAWAP
jgi:hypothetical protein